MGIPHCRSVGEVAVKARRNTFNFISLSSTK
jgi:hypothetical protein